jgi:predicted lipid-binding transport protein (Tim44 family)
VTGHKHHDDIDAIARLRACNPGFELSEFLDGAQIAYETIVTAFLEGDWPALEPLVASDVQDVFLRAIEAREKSNKNADANLIHLAPPEVTHVGIVNGHAEISVRFVGEWLTAPRAGNSDGDDSSISIRTSDEWIFARALQTRDPTWLVTATN